MTTMIALVGGQTLPNFLPVRHYHPSDVLLVYTERMQQQYKYLKTTLQREVNVHGLETDAYNITLIEKALKEELDKLAHLISQPLMFNLTGGTKAMSLAAYQVAQQYSASMMYLESEGKQTRVYHYTWENQQLKPISNELLLECLDLQDMLDLHFGKGNDATGKKIWEENKTNTRSDGGHLFELAIAQTLRDRGYEVKCGVKSKNVEIDVMIRYQNHVAIIEAKTGKHASSFEGIQQLSVAMRYLGGIYTRQFLVINKVPSSDQLIVCDPLRITIVPLLHYKQDMIALAQPDIDTLLATIDKSMKP